jgi:predicted neuraminidase
VPVLTALADASGGSHVEAGWRAFVDISDDGGETWSRSANVEVPGGVGVIQPALWESNAGTVHMMLRSNGGHIYRADSVRGGAGGGMRGRAGREEMEGKRGSRWSHDEGISPAVGLPG